MWEWFQQLLSLQHILQLRNDGIFHCYEIYTSKLWIYFIDHPVDKISLPCIWRRQCNLHMHAAIFDIMKFLRRGIFLCFVKRIWWNFGEMMLETGQCRAKSDIIVRAFDIWNSDVSPSTLTYVFANIVTCISDYRWGLDWWIDLSTTYRW
jgi:hypothetical protein